jgi:hypothetical protein
MPLALPAAFTLARYRLTLEALEPLELPPFKGSALRGGFGYTFKRLVCFQPQPCGKRCQLGNACPYGYVFETSPPEDSEVLSTAQSVSRPFVIHPPDDTRTLIPLGERMTFGLTLIGRGVNYLPYFVAVFKELGQIGLGRTRGRYRLLRVDAWHPYRDERAPVYRAEDERVRDASLPITADEIMAYAATLPADRVTLDFRTPARLKHQGRWTRGGPPFHVLVRRLLDRVSSLSYFHCGQRFQTDFRGLVERATEIPIVHSATRWEDWSRFSGRQKQRVRMGGLVGRVTYGAPSTSSGQVPSTGSGQVEEPALRAYLPLLALGALVHVGKGTVFGNGGYDLVSET